MNWLASLLAGGVVKEFTAPLLDAWKSHNDAKSEPERIAAETRIKGITAARDIAVAESADRWSATRLGRWLVVVPWGVWWAAIYAVSIVNPLFGWSLSIDDVPPRIHDMALVLVPAILIADAGTFIAKRFGR